MKFLSKSISSSNSIPDLQALEEMCKVQEMKATAGNRKRLFGIKKTFVSSNSINFYIWNIQTNDMIDAAAWNFQIL